MEIVEILTLFRQDSIFFFIDDGDGIAVWFESSISDEIQCGNTSDWCTVHNTMLESFGGVAIDSSRDLVMSDAQGMPATAFGEIIDLVTPKHLRVTCFPSISQLPSRSEV